MATAVAHFFKHYPPASMKPGDVFVTNDPWLGTGHLFDYVVMTPVFLGEKPVAIFASTCHVIDVGGVGLAAEGNSVFEEGTLIPHLMLRKAGERTVSGLWDLIGKLVDIFEPGECANYFRSCGYDPE